MLTEFNFQSINYHKSHSSRIKGKCVSHLFSANSALLLKTDQRIFSTYAQKCGICGKIKICAQNAKFSQNEFHSDGNTSLKQDFPTQVDFTYAHNASYVNFSQFRGIPRNSAQFRTISRNSTQFLAISHNCAQFRTVARNGIPTGNPKPQFEVHAKKFQNKVCCSTDIKSTLKQNHSSNL